MQPYYETMKKKQNGENNETHKQTQNHTQTPSHKFSSSAPPKSLSDCGIPSPHGNIIGHRGVPALVPENTLRGLKQAHASGLNWVEFDIQLTRDHHFVLMHDDTLERTTPHKGAVHHYSLEAIKKMDAGCKFKPVLCEISTNSNTKTSTQSQVSSATLSETSKLVTAPKPIHDPVPTFLEVMEWGNSNNVTLNVELKLPENLSKKEEEDLIPLYIASFVRDIKMHWPQTRPLPFISSFNHEILLGIKKQIPTIPVGFLVDDFDPSLLEIIGAHQPCTLNCDHKTLKREDVLLAQQKKIPVMAFTVNNSERIKELLDWGVYAIFTDCGNVMLPLLKNTQKNKL